jgi:hypothetical protein
MLSKISIDFFIYKKILERLNVKNETNLFIFKIYLNVSLISSVSKSDFKIKKKYFEFIDVMIR